MNMKRFFAGLMMLLLSSMVFAADLTPPDELVKANATELLEIIKKDKDIQAGNKKKIKDLVEAKVLPHFDFTRMTRLAVGRFWKQATPAQQQALTNEFRSLLVRTYSASLSSYRDQQIDYKPLKTNPADTEVVVKTLVHQSNGGPSVPLDYSMAKSADGWKVYDIMVDGVSLVVNYRSSFAHEIQQGGIDQLIHTLQAKNGGPVADSKKN
jgi:phospholipid transport system substrate-binding protein